MSLMLILQGPQLLPLAALLSRLNVLRRRGSQELQTTLSTLALTLHQHILWKANK